MPDYTEYVTDPTDGVEYTFTASSPAELETKIHDHFNSAPDEADAPPSMSVDEAKAKLEELEAKKAALMPQFDKTGAQYAGTPEGQAKIQRMMELCGPDDPQRERYASWLSQGMGKLADEAQRRKDKDYRPEHQGPREPLALPDGDDALIQFVVQNRILGNYKVDDTQIISGTTQATLYYMPPERDWTKDAAQSVNVTYPAPIIPGDGVSLLDVIVEAPRDKVFKLLGLDLGEALLDTIDQV